MTRIVQFTYDMCKHDKGFVFRSGAEYVDTANYPAIWKCKNGCGYWLCFDPSEYPDGVWFLDKPRSSAIYPIKPV